MLFEVRQSNGNWCEVSKKISSFEDKWFCNAVTLRRKTGPERWGCVMNTKADKTKPYCSHCLAVEKYLKKIEDKKHE